MAKKEVNATPVVNEDNIVEVLNKQGQIEADITESALKEISDDMKKRRISDAKSAINQAQYYIHKQIINQNKLKKLVKIGKERLEALSKIVDEFVGVIEDGKVVKNGTIDAIEFRKKQEEWRKEYRKQLNEADNFTDELMEKLRNSYQHYWCNEWDLNY